MIVPIFGRQRRDQEPQAPTTAELRQARADEWAERFVGPATAADYRRTFLRYSPLAWNLVESTQGDLLRLLIERVPAEIGVPAIFSLTAAFEHQAKAADAARAALATIVNELSPAHARTLLVSLADAWQNAERTAYERRGTAIGADFNHTLRRLASTTAEERGAVSMIATLLNHTMDDEDEHS